MTNQWFRSWHGAPTDPKWLGIARRANVAPGIVAAVVWALLDRASQANPRGSVAGYDADGLACFMGCEAEQIDKIVAVLHEKEVLTDNTFTGWEKHQPKREDGSAERAKEWRERKRTHTTAHDRNRPTDTDTDTELGETTAREDSALIERKLREAAGWERETAPNLFVTGPIEALIANGADLELDVLPVIRGLAPKVRRPSTWNYFVGAIQDAVAARRAATTGPPANQPVAFPRNPGRTQNGTRNTIAAGFEIIDRAIEQRERQLAEAEGGHVCREDDPLALPRLREGTA